MADNDGKKTKNNKEIAVNAIKVFNEKAAGIEKEKETAEFKFMTSTQLEYSTNVYLVALELKNKLEEIGYCVELDEYIDQKDVSKDTKFWIKIEDNNNCFVRIPYFEYRSIMLDYMQSEKEFIYNELLKMQGNNQDNLDVVAEMIAMYLNYLCHYKELQVKVYENLGWDEYDGKLIFKYDTIKEKIQIPDNALPNLYNKDAYSMQSRCSMTIADNLSSPQTHEENLSEWIKIFTSVMNTSKTASLIIAAACTGLVRQLLPYTKENNINMNIVGKPGSGKSVISHFALSIFGDPQFLEGSFIDTDNAMEINRVERPIIPYILDERMLKIGDKSENAKNQAVLMDVFREYEGKVKEKLSGKGKELSGQRTNAPIISSSVEPMLDYLLKTGHDLGQYRRFIEIELDREEIFEGKSEYAEYVERMAYENYGYGVNLIVDYLFSREESIKEYVEAKYNPKCDEIRELLKAKEEELGFKGLTSSTKRFALIMTTLEIIMEALDDFSKEADTDKIDKSKYDEVLNILVDNITAKMKRVNESYEIGESLQERILDFIDKHKEVFVVQDKEWDGRDYLGRLRDEGKKYIIEIPVQRGCEWILYYGEHLSNEAILNYVKEVGGSEGKKKVKELLPTLINKNYNEQVFIDACARSNKTVTYDKESFQGKARATLKRITVKKDLIDTKNLKNSGKEDE